VLPLAREDLRAFTKLARQPDIPRIVVAGSIKGHNGQPAFRRLQANVGVVKMKSQFRVKLERSAPWHDEQESVQCRGRCGKWYSLVEPPPAVIHSPDSPHRQCAFLSNHGPDTINAGNTDRSKLPLGQPDLSYQPLIPPSRQKHILMHADNEIAPSPLNAKIQTIGRRASVPDENDFMWRAWRQAWRCEQVRIEKLVI
jgi:hypothetical protein